MQLAMKTTIKKRLKKFYLKIGAKLNRKLWHFIIGRTTDYGPLNRPIRYRSDIGVYVIGNTDNWQIQQNRPIYRFDR